MVLNQPDSIAYTLGIENYEYSRYQLGTIISRSGMGLHMMWGPVVVDKAAMEPDSIDGMYTGGTPNGFKNDDELMKIIMHFSMLSGGMAPMNPWPQFAEFQSGDPHLPQPVADDFRSNFESLRWDRSLMDKTLSPGAMGQTLMKQYLWAQDMLGSFHDSLDNGIDPDGTNSPDSVGSPNFDPNNNIFYGGDAADGFIGQVLTAEAINKTKFLLGNLAYNGDSLGAVDPMTYDPANGILYFPHQIAVTEVPGGAMMPPKLDSLTVTDAGSDLFDQLSYLWGTLNFTNMMDPDNSSDAAHLAYHTVFDGNPFPAPMSQTGTPGPYDLMKGTSKVIFLNLMAMHFNDAEGTFVSNSHLINGVAQQGNQISALNAGYVTMVLVKMHEEFASTPLDPMILNAINAQSNFIVQMLKDAAGGFFNGYTIGAGPDNTVKTAVAQAAVARGLYAAYSLTSNNDFLNAANDAYNFLINNFYVPEMMAFKTEFGNVTATYTPLNFAVIAGALREATLVGGHAEGAKIYTRFFKKVANSMQLAEFDPTGESGDDSDGDGVPFLPQQPDGLAPVFAPEAQLNLQVTGVENVIANGENGVSVYPNPVLDQVTLSFNLNAVSDVSIEIFDMTGKRVKPDGRFHASKGAFRTSLNVSDLDRGMYYIRISFGGNELVTKKIVLL